MEATLHRVSESDPKPENRHTPNHKIGRATLRFSGPNQLRQVRTTSVSEPCDSQTRAMRPSLRRRIQRRPTFVQLRQSRRAQRLRETTRRSESASCSPRQSSFRVIRKDHQQPSDAICIRDASGNRIRFSYGGDPDFQQLEPDGELAKPAPGAPSGRIVKRAGVYESLSAGWG